MVVTVSSHFLPKMQRSPASCLQRPIASRGPDIFSHPWAIAVSSPSPLTAATPSSGRHRAEFTALSYSQAGSNRAEPNSCELFLENPHWSPGISTFLWGPPALFHRDQCRQAGEGPSPQRWSRDPAAWGGGRALSGFPVPVCVHTPESSTPSVFTPTHVHGDVHLNIHRYRNKLLPH